MTDQATPAKVRLTDGLGPLVDSEEDPARPMPAEVPLALKSNLVLGVTVGDAVMLRADLYEGPDECHPGGYLAKKGEKLIVRRVSDRVTFEGDVMGIYVSHEDRTDGLTFAVRPSEIGPWRVTPND